MQQKIKVLIVCSGNSGYISPFILEQADSLRKKEISIDFFLIKGKGGLGYFKNYIALIKKIKFFKPNIIHAHYGFSGMLAVLQRKVPVIITFHGSDINENAKNLFISKIAERMASFSVFVNTKLVAKLKPSKSFEVISCGVDLEQNVYLDKKESRLKLGLDPEKKIILFSSNFLNSIKNYPLAKKAIDLINNVELIEMKGYNRKEITLLMNACDGLLVTSLSESGPLVVKEAMACGCPVVSTDVGDVESVIGGIKGCYITSFDPIDVAEKLNKIINANIRINGRERIINLGLDIDRVATNIINVYLGVLNKKKLY